MPGPRRSVSGWPAPTYRVTAEFSAPRAYVFRWCTDYRADDAKLEGEHFERRILKRSPTEVVYEDLERQKGGWFWSRHVVRLDPPNGWHSDTVGSHRQYSLDYRLSDLPSGGTRLVLTARRRPYGVGGPNPAKAEWERSVTETWKQFSRALEKDYQRSRQRR